MLPSNWIIDWRRFHEVASPNPADVPLNPSRKIDPFVVPTLHTLPGGGGSLPFRNLKRGVMLGLPSGQDVARAMKITNPLTPDEIAKGHGRRRRQEARPAPAARRSGTTSSRRREQRGNGERLGPVGATIVAEVFVGLVHGDHVVPVARRARTGSPTLPSRTPGDFTMADLLRFVGDISPIDGITTVNTL